MAATALTITFRPPDRGRAAAVDALPAAGTSWMPRRSQFPQSPSSSWQFTKTQEVFLRQHDLRPVEVPGDGNCFFHALVEVVHRRYQDDPGRLARVMPNFPRHGTSPADAPPCEGKSPSISGTTSPCTRIT
jgi:hypothetical protein